jgi:hypothetical protein
MSYLLYNGTDITPYFYTKTSATNGPGATTATGFLINGTDISNTYVGLGTNSNIPVSQILGSSGFLKNGTDIATLYELNLIQFTGTINTDYKIWAPSGHSGFLIQILTSSAQLKFNNNITDCSFAMIGGGGGGGGMASSGNAGGGGGAGELITGTITIPKDGVLTFIIGVGGTGGTTDKSITTYGSGSAANDNSTGNSGTSTKITYGGSNSLEAYGGGGGGGGKGSTQGLIGCSTGGTGSYSNNAPGVGSKSAHTLTVNTVFKSLISYGNIGGVGANFGNDNGGGGGGGGAGGLGQNGDYSSSWNGVGTTKTSGGVGLTINYGSTPFSIGGGGGGGTAIGFGSAIGQAVAGGGQGGNADNTTATSASTINGFPGTANTGGGGGGGYNGGGKGGAGGSGTVIIYITDSKVS